MSYNSCKISEFLFEANLNMPRFIKDSQFSLFGKNVNIKHLFLSIYRKYCKIRIYRVSSSCYNKSVDLYYKIAEWLSSFNNNVQSTSGLLRYRILGETRWWIYTINYIIFNYCCKVEVVVHFRRCCCVCLIMIIYYLWQQVNAVYHYRDRLHGLIRC